MTETSSERAPGRPAAPALLTFAGLAAAFGAASCCGLPLLLTSLGLGSTWLASVALLTAPNRSVLLAIATAGLLGGGFLLWRQSRAGACAPGSVCARPAFRGAMLTGLIAGVLLLYLGFAYA